MTFLGPVIGLPNSARSKRQRRYLPTLDGWRAIAILAVVFHHDSLHTAGTNVSTLWLYEYGSLGVDVFFAISGLLICSRLLDEEEIIGKISLRNFYIRRALRILPPAILYLGTLSILSALAIITVTKAEFIESLLFFRNTTHFLSSGPQSHDNFWYTGHFWSLSLEEQFYLFLPASFLLVKPQYRPWILGCFAINVAAYRYVILASTQWQLVQYHTDVRLDALLVPAMIAMIAARQDTPSGIQVCLRFWPIGLIALGCLIPLGQNSALRNTALIWLFPIILLGSIMNPGSLLGRLLEWDVLRYIGRISYGLYLWQQLFFTGHFHSSDHPLRMLESWPLRLVITFALAILSYHLVERPLTRLSQKLAPSATTGR